ncbi:hypothetical protein [Ellagibacter isourolithinifaciens]|uniref:hypothetical protein n=1 Tax=Ellagibacter isourolithinifaciens TaxID=2137581 RepID=UPI0023F08EC4|nr:hypothetical protein [Ellagibacter isourolithinifaciens]MDD5926387.1 hypothetical protein [Ellagibacter isourolithinifaciens]
MSTIFVATSINLEGEEKKQFLDTIEGAVAKVFKCYSIYYTPVPKENCSECAKDQITFFVFVPPYMEIERRRELIKVLDEAANEAVGYRGELKNIVIFKYHDDEACGVDGVLRADAKAAAEK